MTNPHSKLMRVKEICDWLNVSESAIYKWVNEGRFPKPIKLGARDAKRHASRWRREEVEQWLKEKSDRE